MRNNRVLLGCVGLFLFLAGCSSGPEQSIKIFVENTKKQIPDPITPLPELSLAKVMTYDAGHLRSPFEPATTSLLDKPTFSERPKALLEHYPLDSLRMVGTLARKNRMSALIRDRSGWVHQVHVNDRIGQHLGKVVSITENSIEVIEWIVDNKGSWMERRVPINLT